jgi:hypothetical protein
VREQVVVDLTTPPSEAELAADEVRRFLLERGIAKENDAPDPLWQGAELVPGERWAEAVEEQARAERRWLHELGTGVDVVAGPRRWDDGAGGPSCPSCGHDLELEGGTDVMLADPQRIISCPNCGRRSRLHKWHVGGGVEGALAVRFEGWPPLADDLVEALGMALGGVDLVVVTRER